MSLSLAQAQDTAQQPIEHKLEFTVASVKENKLQGKSSSNVPLDRSNSYSSNGGTFSATNQPLIAYLIFAYKVKIGETRSGLMHHLPEWAVQDRFDIVAKSESQNPTKDEMRLMVQSLLEERFKLKVHREMREGPVFGLHLVKLEKTGSQLKSHDPNSSCSAPLPVPKTGTSIAAIVGLWPTSCGDGAEVRSSKYRLREGGRDMSINAIADWLTGSGESELPILDQTGLKGTFDFILEFDPESLGREAASNVPLEDSGPTFNEAMKDQLGLRLEKEEGSYSLFFVDNVEYPTAN